MSATEGIDMKVSELIERLKSMPQDVEVILQKDAEGNGYSPLHAVDDEAIYKPQTTWYGEMYSTNWSAHDAGFASDEWEEFKKQNQRCVVLAPVN